MGVKVITFYCNLLVAKLYVYSLRLVLGTITYTLQQLQCSIACIII